MLDHKIPETWPLMAAPTPPPRQPSPVLRNPELLAHLTGGPRPDSVEADSNQPCGWCLTPLEQGEHHTRPVHYTPDGAEEPVVYGSSYCAQMDYEGVLYLGTQGLVEPAPHRGWAVAW